MMQKTSLVFSGLLIILTVSVLNGYAAAKSKHPQGYCCVDNHLSLADNSQCLKNKNALFFTDARKAGEVCKSTPSKPAPKKRDNDKQTQGFCCWNDKVFAATQSECRQKKEALFFTDLKKAQQSCESLQLGYCCSEGKVSRKKRSDCKRQTGIFFLTDIQTARKLCKESTPGFCCINGELSEKTKGECSKSKKSHFFTDRKKAAAICASVKPGLCCIRGKLIPKTQGECLKSKEHLFFPEMVIVKARQECADLKPGFCCVNSEIHRATLSDCLDTLKGIFYHNRSSAGKACAKIPAERLTLKSVPTPTSDTSGKNIADKSSDITPNRAQSPILKISKKKTPPSSPVPLFIDRGIHLSSPTHSNSFLPGDNIPVTFNFSDESALIPITEITLRDGEELVATITGTASVVPALAAEMHVSFPIPSDAEHSANYTIKVSTSDGSWGISDTFAIGRFLPPTLHAYAPNGLLVDIQPKKRIQRTGDTINVQLLITDPDVRFRSEGYRIEAYIHHQNQTLEQIGTWRYLSHHLESVSDEGSRLNLEATLPEDISGSDTVLTFRLTGYYTPFPMVYGSSRPFFLVSEIGDAGTSTPSHGITVQSPNGGERWSTGSTHSISWLDYETGRDDSLTSVLSYTVQILENTRTIQTIQVPRDQPVQCNPDGPGRRRCVTSWRIPDTTGSGSTYSAAVQRGEDRDTSNNTFSISSVWIEAPAITRYIGRRYRFSWGGTVNNVDIYLTTTDGHNLQRLSTGERLADGAHSTQFSWLAGGIGDGNTNEGLALMPPASYSHPPWMPPSPSDRGPDTVRSALPDITNVCFKVVETSNRNNYVLSEPFTISFPRFTADIPRETILSGRNFPVTISWEGDHIASRARVVVDLFISYRTRGRVRSQIAEQDFSSGSKNYNVSLANIKQIVREDLGMAALAEVDINYIWFQAYVKGWNHILFSNTNRCSVHR